MASSLSPARLIGNLAALAMLPVVGSVAVDYIGGLLGYKPETLCSVLPPIVQLAGMVATLIVSLGAIIYIVSRFRSDGGVALMIGGVLLFVAPMLLPHYLNANCSAWTTKQTQQTAP